MKQRSLNQIRHCLTRHIQIWHHFLDKKILKYFSGFEIRNFSVSWLKWTQTMEMKQNLIFSMTHIQIWRHVFFYQKISNYFNDFQNRDFPVLWLKWTQTLEIKQNQTLSMKHIQIRHQFFISRKLLKYFNDFYSWHLSISLRE